MLLNPLLMAVGVSVLSASEIRLSDAPLPTDICLNGGRMINGACECTLRYEGARCEKEKCQNGGRRHNSKGQVRCHCPFGFTGDKCEKVNYCEAGKGELINGKCKCFEKWTGQFCHIRTCYNGVPTGGMEGFCLCELGYTGPFCDQKLECENGGFVNEDNECTCKPGYTGDRCEECAEGHHKEDNYCVPEISEHPLLGASQSEQFPWAILVSAGAGCAVLLLIILSAVYALRKWKAKPSRVSSVQGEKEGTDV